MRSEYMNASVLSTLVNITIKTVKGMFELNQLNEEMRNNVSIMYRLLYLECRRNIEFIKTVNLTNPGSFIVRMLIKSYN